MRCVFLVPPSFDGHREVERVFGCTYGLYPIPNIFFLYVAAVFLKNGYKTEYIDAPVLSWSKKKFLDYIKNNKSDIYLFYTVNLAKQTDKIAAEYIKSIYPDSWVIFMGPSATYEPFEYLKEDFSIVIAGEMEETAGDLAQNLARVSKEGTGLLRLIKGIHYKINGRVESNPVADPIVNIDNLAFPARHLIRKEKYYNPKLSVTPFTALLTSRGCLFRCRYCVPNSQSFARELAYRIGHDDYRKPKVTVRSFENVYAELKEIKKDGYKGISIIDDQFISDGIREIKIAQAMGELGFVWGCLSRADKITENIAKAFSENNCRYVDVGVESFSQDILDDIKKGALVGKMYNGIKLLKKYSVPIKLNILFGASPKETLTTIRYTMKVVNDLNVDSVMVGICNPFPGTEFWDIAQKERWMEQSGYRPVDVQKEATITYAHLTSRMLEKEVKKANISFFLSPKFISKNLDRFKNPFTLLKDCNSLLKKLTKP